MGVREYVKTDGLSKGHHEQGAQLRIFIALKYCMFTVEKNILKEVRKGEILRCIDENIILAEKEV